MINEGFHAGSYYHNVKYQSVANFVYLQKSRRTAWNKSNTSSHNNSKILLPCLPTSISRCLPPSVSIRSPLRMVDWQTKISHLTRSRNNADAHYFKMTAHPSVSYLDDSIFPIVYERKHHHYQSCDKGQVSK